MKLVEICYIQVQRDSDGNEIKQQEQRIYLPMCDSVAEAAREGLYDFGLTLALHHIAELQGYNFKEISHVTY